MVNGDMQHVDETEEGNEKAVTTKPRGKTRTQLKSVDNLNPNVPEFIPPTGVNGKKLSTPKDLACGVETGDSASSVDVIECVKGIDSMLKVGQNETRERNCDSTGE